MSWIFSLYILFTHYSDEGTGELWFTYFVIVPIIVYISSCVLYGLGQLITNTEDIKSILLNEYQEEPNNEENN